MFEYNMVKVWTAVKKSIFPTVFPKTAEKKMLIIFFAVLLKQRKKIIHFLRHFSKNSRENKFKYIFSAFFSKTLEKIYLYSFSPTLFQKQQKNVFIFSVVHTCTIVY